MTISKRFFRNLLLTASLLPLLLLSCSTVPVTGRKQLHLVSDSAMLSMSFQQYDEFLNEHPASPDSQQTRMVRTVGKQIQQAVEQYFIKNNMAHEISKYQWEFNLIDNEEKNAWAMPGGKVVVYSGILPVTRDEAGLAVVMGHEIAHAVARHGNERMSQGLMTQMGGIALSTALSKSPQATQELWLQAFGIGTQVGFLLPYSRVQENEADHLGLIFMAMAGYDPNAALDFWERMSREKSGSAPPEFLSTHPSDATRLRNIRAMIPDVMPYYQQSKRY